MQTMSFDYGKQVQQFESKDGVKQANKYAEKRRRICTSYEYINDFRALKLLFIYFLSPMN